MRSKGLLESMVLFFSILVHPMWVLAEIPLEKISVLANIESKISDETLVRYRETILPFIEEFGHRRGFEGRPNQDCLTLLNASPGEFPAGYKKATEEACRVVVGYIKIYDPSKPSNNAAVVAPGLGEAYVKYQEVGYFLAQEGYNPVYIIDHRGQGSSTRLSPLYAGRPRGESPIHVDRFENYILDFAKMINIVNMGMDPPEKIFLLSNSTGGSIITGYLTRPDLRAKNIAAYGNVSPFFVPGARSNIEKFAMYSARKIGGTDAQFWLANKVLSRDCNLNNQDVYPMPCLFEYDGGTPRHYSFDTAENSNYLRLTTSPEQYNLNKWLVAQNDGTEVGDKTRGWVLRAMDYLADLNHSYTEYNTPTYYFVGTDDVVVSPVATKMYYDHLLDVIDQKSVVSEAGNRLTPADFQFETIPGAAHEILNESDEIRLYAFKKIMEFFEQYK
ncbi:MAG: alpha/beta hydrolase [Bdellovibrionales bacterium]